MIEQSRHPARLSLVENLRGRYVVGQNRGEPRVAEIVEVLHGGRPVVRPNREVQLAIAPNPSV